MHLHFLKFSIIQDQACWTKHYEVVISQSVLIIFSESASPTFIKLNMFRQTLIRYDSSTFHDIFPTPPNIVTQLDNVIEGMQRDLMHFYMRLLTRFEGFRRFASNPYTVCAYKVWHYVVVFSSFVLHVMPTFGWNI